MSNESTLQVDIAIIGWGKGGKTLAAGLGKAGKRIALIEQSAMMAGGTCINIGCVPTKALVHQASVAKALAAQGHLTSSEDFDQQFRKAVAARDGLIDKVRAVNFQMLDEVESVILVDGFARFDGDASGEVKSVRVTGGDDTLIVEAPTVIINTGSVPVIPSNIDGICEDIRDGGANIALDGQAEMSTANRGIFTSTTIQHANPRPENLVIVGGGFIALEFASMFASFGSKVTVLNRSASILGREDEPVRAEVRAVLEESGITILDNAAATAITGRCESGDLAVRATVGGDEREIQADGILLATGRRPATDGLGLEDAGIAVGEKGEIVVDGYLRASVPGVFAIGDVNGGPQHTYISLDDFRIVKDQLVGEGRRSVKDRVAVPATTFIQPPFSQVGLTAEQAREQGFEVLTATKKVAAIKAMPRPKTLGDPRGLISVVVDAKTDLILGARLFHVDSQEVINLIALAMRAGVTASELRDGIWTHPASTEALNEVLGELA